MWTALDKKTFSITGPVSSTEFIEAFTVDTVLKITTYASLAVPENPPNQSSSVFLSYIDPSGNDIQINAGGLTLNPHFGETQGFAVTVNYCLVKANQPLNYSIQVFDSKSYAFLSGYTINMLLETSPY